MAPERFGTIPRRTKSLPGPRDRGRSPQEKTWGSPGDGDASEKSREKRTWARLASIRRTCGQWPNRPLAR